MAGTGVIDVTDVTFERDVIEASYRQPVVVDFWAPWCGPCVTLGPMIERIAAEHPDVRLVKINVDDSPMVAQAFAIESIPAVMAFFNGDVASSFLGAMPEPDVRAFFDRLGPAPADLLVAEADAALAAGDFEGAAARYGAAFSIDGAHPGARAGLASLLIDEGEIDEAEALLNGTEATAAVQAQRARIAFARGTADVDVDALLARLAADEDDVPAHYGLGCIDASAGRYEDALEHFLTVVMFNREYEADGGRLRALEIFDLLGPDDPRTHEYRRRLGMLLF
ncbi:MAG: tetratricopeptide repeat protein [Chloroflexi bacterium]|nr:tetratricopeptide repeat protein [Chloroflexota bacterium]MDA1240554.1 tetratricopeptide repeat protein [Chloroflexota bacterium]MQC48022.1 co-chaperone YbbN [Chloroflexota bacterium]